MKFHTCDMRFEMATRLDPRGKLFSEKEFCLTSRTVRSRDTTSGGILGAQRVPGRRVEGKGRCVLGRARRGAAAHARALGATRWLTTCVRVVLAGAAPRPRHHRHLRAGVCAGACAQLPARTASSAVAAMSLNMAPVGTPLSTWPRPLPRARQAPRRLAPHCTPAVLRRPARAALPVRPARRRLTDPVPR